MAFRVTIGGVTKEQPLEDPAEEQPIVAMRDLGADPSGADTPASAGPAYQPLPLPNARQWITGGLLLALSAICIVAALVLPLYELASVPSFAERNGEGGMFSDVTFQVTAWGLNLPAGYGVVAGSGSSVNLIQVLVGPAPVWGVPLVAVAVLLAGSAVLVWRRGVRAMTPMVFGSVALFAGIVVAMGTFLVSATRNGTIVGAGVRWIIGPSFWILVLALVLAVVGAVISHRNQTPSIGQPVERIEPDTPALGFPVPDLDR